MQPRTSVSGLRPRWRGFGAEFVEIDVDDFGGDRVVGPAFFDEGDEQGAGFLDGAQAEGLAGGGVGVALDGGVGGDDQDVAGFGGGAGGCCAGLDDAEDGNGDGVLNGVEGEGAGGVAGDDEEFGALLAGPGTARSGRRSGRWCGGTWSRRGGGRCRRERRSGPAACGG